MSKTGIIGGVGAVALAAAGAVTVTNTDLLESISSEPQEIAQELPPLFQRKEATNAVESKLSARDGIQICATWLNAEQPCLSRKEVLKLQNKPLMKRIPPVRMGDTMSEKEMTVALSHPSDFSAPAEVFSNCADFNAAKADSWGAVSSADMADEQWFVVRCGLFKLVEMADTFEETGFNTGTLDEVSLRSIPGTAWPVVGEMNEGTDLKIHRPANPLTMKESERAWVVRYGNMKTVVNEIAHADFDGDDVGDILVLLNARLDGGTAGVTTYALVHHEEGSLTMIPEVVY